MELENILSLSIGMPTLLVAIYGVYVARRSKTDEWNHPATLRSTIHAQVCMLTVSFAPGHTPRQQHQSLLPTHNLDQRPSTTRRLIYVEETIWSTVAPEAVPLASIQGTLPDPEEVD